MKKLLFAVLIVQAIFASCSNKNIENWKTKVNGAIFSTPTINKGLIYIGTEEGYFYCIDTKSGNIVKEVKIASPIRSNALVIGNIVFVESIGHLYCFNASSLEQIFKVSPNDETIDMVDPWDYFHTTPVEYEGNIYYAGNKGKVYIVNPENGNIIKTITTPEGAAIRSSLTIEGGNLYFGDNNGVIYEYNLISETFTMAYHTYKERLYSTYGYIIGGPFIKDGKIIFSNRHEKFTALDLKTKSIVWTKPHDFSWWSAVPLISNNKVIIGGSDNLILAALSLETGKTLWEYLVDYNNFCTPLVINNTLILGTGDSYLNRKGDGSVFSVNLENGSLVNKYKPGGNVFSSPITLNNNTIICTTTGNIISIKNEFFTNPKPSKVTIDGDLNFDFEDGSSAIAEKQLTINILADKASSISFTFKTKNNFSDTLIKVKGLRDKVYAKGNHKVYIQVNRGSMPSGEYSGELIAKINNEQETVVKPFTINIKGNANKNEADFDVTSIEPDSKDGSVKIMLKVNKQMVVNAYLIDAAKEDSIAGYIISTKVKWGIYRLEKDIYSADYNRLTKGKYKIVFEGNGLKKKYDFSKD